MILLQLFFTFFKLGLFTFGGGYAMISLIQEASVEKHKWLTEEEFSDIIAIAESTPGPISVNSATYIGYKQKGILGSIVATFGLIVPSLIIIFIISKFLSTFLEFELVANAFLGIQCAVAVLIVNATFKLAKGMKKNIFSYIIIFLTFTISMLINIFALNFSSIFIILGGAICGIVYYTLIKKEDL